MSDLDLARKFRGEGRYQYVANGKEYPFAGGLRWLPDGKVVGSMIDFEVGLDKLILGVIGEERIDFFKMWLSPEKPEIIFFYSLVQDKESPQRMYVGSWVTMDDEQAYDNLIRGIPEISTARFFNERSAIDLIADVKRDDLEGSFPEEVRKRAGHFGNPASLTLYELNRFS